MNEERTTQELEYNSSQQNKEQPKYTPRPKSHVIMAWILLAVVIFAILGMCYWQIFGIF